MAEDRDLATLGSSVHVREPQAALLAGSGHSCAARHRNCPAHSASQARRRGHSLVGLSVGCALGKRKPQISPLRYAPVEMTSWPEGGIPLVQEIYKPLFQTNLSSRPERSVVERSAVSFSCFTDPHPTGTGRIGNGGEGSPRNRCRSDARHSSEN